MTVIVCVDDKGGMMFGGRRQSKDARLRERMLEMARGSILRMSPYSATQFLPDDAIVAQEDYLAQLTDKDYCFVEDGALPPHPSRLVIYRWNRRYPADREFPFDPLENGYHLVSSTEFVGSSHDTITEDIYDRK